MVAKVGIEPTTRGFSVAQLAYARLFKPATRREPGSAANIEVASATSTAAEPGNSVISSLRAGCDFDSGHGFVDASAAVAATPAP
jgi:hypothetical protein